MRDLYSNLDERLALAPADQNATVNGVSIALAGNNGCVFAIATGVITAAGAFAASLEDSPDGSAWAAVPAKWVQSDAPATLAAASSYRLGYTGPQNFVRLKLTKSGGTSIFAAAVAILKPNVRPVA